MLFGVVCDRILHNSSVMNKLVLPEGKGGSPIRRTLSQRYRPDLAVSSISAGSSVTVGGSHLVQTADC